MPPERPKLSKILWRKRDWPPIMLRADTTAVLMIIPAKLSKSSITTSRRKSTGLMSKKSGLFWTFFGQHFLHRFFLFIVFATIL
jgi:hypothetical protein